PRRTLPRQPGRSKVFVLQRTSCLFGVEAVGPAEPGRWRAVQAGENLWKRSMPAPAPENTVSKLQARPIPVPPATPAVSAQTTLLTLSVVVAILYLGQDLLVPFALAVLLSFVLS